MALQGLLSFDPFFKDHQQYQTQAEGRQHEIVGPQEKQAQKSGNKSDIHGQVTFEFQPLVYEDADKEAGGGKIDAGKIQGDQVSEGGSDDASCDPGQMAEHRAPEVAAYRVHIRRVVGAAEHTVDLIGKGKDHIGIELSLTLEALRKANAVKHVSGVDQKGRSRHDQKGRVGHDHGDQGDLKGTGIDEYGGQQGMEPGVTRFLHHDAEGKAHHKVGENDGKHLPEGIKKGFFLMINAHGSISLSLTHMEKIL